jgi:PAS domain S-box-containing protein
MSFRRDAVRIFVFALAYFLAHELAFGFPDAQKVPMAVWPAGGIGLAALLLNRRRLWPIVCPALFMAGLAADLLAGRPAVASVGFMAANMAESLGGAAFISWVCGQQVRFVRLREILALGGAATFVNAGSAALGAGVAAFTSHAAFRQCWLTWWVSHGFGLWLITALIVTWSSSRNPLRRLSLLRIVEAGVFLAPWCTAAWLVFHPAPILWGLYARPYMLIALLAWPALRFGQRGLTAALVVLAAIALTSEAVVSGPPNGPFVYVFAGGASVSDRLLGAQIFLAFAALTSMLLAASRAESETAKQELEAERSFFRTLFQDLPEVAWLKSPEGVFLAGNAGMQRLLGKKECEIVGKTDFDFLPAAQAEAFRASDRATIAAGGPTVTQEALPGHDVVMETIKTALRDGSGKLIGVLGVSRDITEHKRNELAQVEDAARRRILMEESKDGIAVSDSAGRLREWNRSFAEMLGYEPEEMAKLSVLDWDVQMDLGRLRELAQSVVIEPVTFETRHRRKDGTLYDVEVSVSGAEIGGEALIFSTHRDITEHKQAEAQLKQEKDFSDAIINGLPGVFYMFNAQRRLVRWNDEFCRVLGISPEEAAKTVMLDHIAENDRAGVAAAFDSASAGEHVSIEADCVTSNGSQIPYRLAGRRLRLGDEDYLVGMGYDISQRRRTERALRESQRQYLALAKCIPDLLWCMDLEDRITYVSPSVERIYGWTVEEALQLHRRDLGTPLHLAQRGRVLEDELKAALAPGYDRSRVLTWESEHVRKDGSTMWVEVACSIMWSEDGRPIGWTGVTRDITARKRVEAEREKLRGQLVQAQKMESIGRLAGGVAHDFNNLLTVINGYSELALAGLRVGDPLRHRLEMIQKAGERAAGLTQQLLAFSRKQILQPRVLELNSVVEDMQSMLRRLLGEDVEVQLALSAGNPTVQADPHQLEQVIMNLAVNARDSMPNGGRLLVETGFVVRDERPAAMNPEIRPGRYAMLAVSDTGFGMDEATMQRVFEPFFTTKEAGKGTGLGLSTVQGIVAQSGGHINVYSEPGYGTTFKIYLPAVAGRAAEAEEPAVIQELRGNETILVVEDQEDVRDFAVATLEGYGYRVIAAANAGEALLICEQAGERIHLVLTDVVMPRTSGRELVARLIKLRPEIKALFMSGYTDNVIVHRGVLDEGAHFIQKPFRPADLAGKVRAILGLPT